MMIMPLFLAAAACSTKSNFSTGVPSQPLIPLTPGNSWVYLDSSFDNNNGGVFDKTWQGTMTVGSTTTSLQGSNGGEVVFYQVSDTAGWFLNTFLAVDPTNTAVYGLDSASGGAYVLFGTSTTDGAELGQSVDTAGTNGCSLTYTLYGWSSSVVINGHTCLHNVQTTVNCNNFTTEQINTYIAPGVGVVRIEDYESDSTKTHLNKSYTQTLSTYTVQ